MNAPSSAGPAGEQGTGTTGRKRSRWDLMAMIAILLLVVAMAAASGAVSIPWARLVPLLWSPESQGTEGLWRSVLIDVRLPRIALGMLVGAGLATAGAQMQALFRNPLAEPGLVGVSLGAAAGAVLAIVCDASQPVIVTAAIGGSLAATGAAYALGRHDAGPAGILLAGIAINAICASVIGLCSYVADDAQLRNLTFWNLGSLAASGWAQLAWLAPWSILLLMLMAVQWRALNALLLGEREAQQLGYALRPLRRRLIVLTALLVGPLVAVSGTIVFVGLVVPHLVRMAVGAEHRVLLPRVVVAGALSLTLADWLARVCVIPAELPIGIITSLVGGPILLLMMRRGAGPG